MWEDYGICWSLLQRFNYDVMLVLVIWCYEAWLHFETRVRVWDSTIFENGGCGWGGIRQLKNY